MQQIDPKATSSARADSTTAAPPRVSVVICTFNRQELLSRALRAFAGLAGAEQCEIVVVDNNSADDTRETVRRCAELLAGSPPVRYEMETRQGLSYARNTGVEVARGAIVAFLDDDAEPAASWLRTILAAYADQPQLVALGGPVVPRFEAPRPAWLCKEMAGYYTILDRGRTPHAWPKGPGPYGANMAFTREVLIRHPFPGDLGRRGTALLSNEEDAVLARIRASGALVFYHPQMSVTHFVPAERLTPAWIEQRYYYAGASRAVAARSGFARLRLRVVTLAKRIYLVLRAVIPIPVNRLLLRCRQRACTGVADGLAGRLEN